MFVLGIDTSTPTVSVALAADERVVSRRDDLANNKHGEVLTALVAEVLRDAGVAASDLSAIGVGLGPGPFTGLRVGIVTAAAMSDALGIPCYGGCSLDVVHMARATEAQPFAVVTDARRRQVYWALYDASGVRIDGPDIAPAAEVVERLRGRVHLLIGPGATQYADTFRDFVVGETAWPDAGGLAITAGRRIRAGDRADALTPLYLRRPDARQPGPPKRVTPV